MWRAESDEIAVIDDGDAVAELVGLFHVVGGDEHGEVASLAQVVEHLPDGDAGDGIEAGGGFVEKKDAADCGPGRERFQHGGAFRRRGS